MAVLTKRIVSKRLSEEPFREAFPEFTQAFSFHDDYGSRGRGSCTRCRPSKPAYDAVVVLLKQDTTLSERLRKYLDFGVLEIVEKIQGRVSKTRLAG